MMTSRLSNTPQSSAPTSGGWADFSKNKAGIAAAGGGLAALFQQLFGGGGMDPMKDASSYLDRGYDPYIEQGRQVDPKLMEQFMGLVNDPNALFSKFGSGFQKSPGYQFQLNEGLNAANNAAAAGGMAGSGANQYSAQQTAQGLANKDYYNFMDHIMNLYGTGLQGLGNISQRGYNASTGKADRMSAMSFANAANQNQKDSDFWSSIFKGGASLLPYAMM